MSTPAAGRSGSRRRLVAGVVVAVLVVAGWFLWPADGSDGPADRAAPIPAATSASQHPAGRATSRPAAVDPESGLRFVELAALPAEAGETVELIRAGGPFPYARDGIVFGNREGRLPRQRSGWYHEYTVPTPGGTDRGARRIVTGDGGRAFFYSGDHYASFRRVRTGG